MVRRKQWVVVKGLRMVHNGQVEMIIRPYRFIADMMMALKKPPATSVIVLAAANPPLTPV
ncbi:MAG: hypothetical protein IPL78_32020 [Chloroflexi bacterium]|nr:hypothetical protein [Chloroflexota bacterium]